MNYFELFNFPTAFALDTNMLAERYRELQRAVHPDKFANASEQQKMLSMQRTAQINDGYQTLKHPLSRAEHLLAVQGLEIRHETTTLKDTAFLMQQMEWREILEDIQQSSDPEDLIDELYDSFAEYEQQLYQQLAQIVDTLTPDLHDEAADLIRKLKFMAKLQVELARIEDERLD